MADVMAVSNIILFGHCSVADVIAGSDIILCGHRSVADVMAVSDIIFVKSISHCRNPNNYVFVSMI